MSDTSEADPILALTTEIVAAYVGNNSVPRSELASVIADTFGALVSLRQPASTPAQPAVPVRKSVTPDYLISLEDGRRYRSLRRHLATVGLTPEQYRQKWDLPHDYPMVAPNYSKRRSELARAMGLGRKSGAVDAPAAMDAKPAQLRRGPS